MSATPLPSQSVAADDAVSSADDRTLASAPPVVAPSREQGCLVGDLGWSVGISAADAARLTPQLFGPWSDE